MRMISTEACIRDIVQILAQFGNVITLENGVSFFNTNHVGEDFCRELLNRLFGWHLVNQNAVQLNAAGYDLIDVNHRILIQVSSHVDAQKVKQSLSQLGGFSGFHLYFLSLSTKHTCRSRNFAIPPGLVFDPQSDILDFVRILQICRSLDNDHLRSIHQLFLSYFTSPSQDGDNLQAPVALTCQQLDRIIFCIAQVDSLEDLLISYCDEFIASPESEGGKARRRSVNGMLKAQFHMYFTRSAQILDELFVELVGHYELWKRIGELRRLNLAIDLLPQPNESCLDVKAARLLMAEEREVIRQILTLTSKIWPHPDQVFELFYMAIQ